MAGVVEAPEVAGWTSVVPSSNLAPPPNSEDPRGTSFSDAAFHGSCLAPPPSPEASRGSCLSEADAAFALSAAETAARAFRIQRSHLFLPHSPEACACSSSSAAAVPQPAAADSAEISIPAKGSAGEQTYPPEWSWPPAPGSYAFPNRASPASDDKAGCHRSTATLQRPRGRPTPPPASGLGRSCCSSSDESPPHGPPQRDQGSSSGPLGW